MRLFLASQSPRRLELLRQLGYTPISLAPAAGAETEALEQELPGEDPTAYVMRVALLKLKRGVQTLAALPELKAGSHDLILAADTTVALRGEILGKPGSPDQAEATLRKLSGKTHQVHTAVACCRFGEGRPIHALASADVRFAALSEDWIQAYVTSQEPMDKAGSYAIQGLAAAMIPEIQGSYSAIVGLPLFETYRLIEGLRDVGGMPVQQHHSRATL